MYFKILYISSTYGAESIFPGVEFDVDYAHYFKEINKGSVSLFFSIVSGLLLWSSGFKKTKHLTDRKTGTPSLFVFVLLVDDLIGPSDVLLQSENLSVN